MIPWWFVPVGEGKKFLKHKRKQQSMIENARQDCKKQKLIVLEKIEDIRIAARNVSRRLGQNKKHMATESMMSVSMDLQNAEPILTAYVNALLKQRTFEIMHLDGFVEPNALPKAMADIDYGLYSLSTEDELHEMLSEAVDPLAIIGLESD
tara:strand:- start:440 stop:892 length:453 start_codon:yes stop_codon:yes gene_type:complete